MNSDEAQAAQITIAIGNFGLLLAALLMRMFVSREGLRDSMGWKRPFKFYLLALTTPILFFGILALFNHLTGLGRFIWTRADMPFAAYLGIELLIGAFIISIFILGEEYGWRGYLLPCALALGEARGTILVGLVWAFWHLPLLLVGLNYPGVSPPLPSRSLLWSLLRSPSLLPGCTKPPLAVSYSPVCFMDSSTLTATG
jgi:uncharacterized protein